MRVFRDSEFAADFRLAHLREFLRETRITPHQIAQVIVRNSFGDRKSRRRSDFAVRQGIQNIARRIAFCEFVIARLQFIRDSQLPRGENEFGGRHRRARRFADFGDLAQRRAGRHFHFRRRRQRTREHFGEYCFFVMPPRRISDGARRRKQNRRRQPPLEYCQTYSQPSESRRSGSESCRNTKRFRSINLSKPVGARPTIS